MINRFFDQKKVPTQVACAKCNALIVFYGSTTMPKNFLCNECASKLEKNDPAIDKALAAMKWAKDIEKRQQEIGEANELNKFCDGDSCQI